MISDLVHDVVSILDVIQDPQIVEDIAIAREHKANTLENSLQFLGALEIWVINSFTGYGKLVLERLRHQKNIEDSEKKVFALNNITTLIPELNPHKFNIKEELTRMEEALLAGYQEDDNERPVNLGKLLKIFRTKNIFKTEKLV
jgi:hypothetical protein